MEPVSFASAEEAAALVEQGARELLEQVPESRVEALPSEAVRELFRYLRQFWEEATRASQWDDETLRLKVEAIKGTHIGLRAGITAVPEIMGIPLRGATAQALHPCGNECWDSFVYWNQTCYEQLGGGRWAAQHCYMVVMMHVYCPCIARCWFAAVE